MVTTYRIGEVAKLLGMSTHALRAWERRHAIVAPERTTQGDRLYSAKDLQRLTLVKQLAELGHSLTEIARLSTVELQGLLERTRALMATAR